MARNHSILDQTVATLLNYIKTNELAPGDRMPTEKQACEMTGAGRSTVREAYRVLQARGVVTSLQGKGIFLSNTLKLTAPKSNPFGDEGMRIEDYMDVRMAIETTSVKLAIRNATAEQIDELQHIQDVMVQSVSENDAWKMAEMDEKFHAAIALMTNNPLMIQVHNLVAKYFKAFRVRSFRNATNKYHALPKHAMIIQAFREQNCELGVLVMSQHLEQSHDDIKSQLSTETEVEPPQI